jgi:hypothetical protein
MPWDRQIDKLDGFPGRSNAMTLPGKSKRNRGEEEAMNKVKSREFRPG